MARAFSTLGNSQKPPQKNDRKHKDRNSGHSGDSLWQSAIPWWLVHSNPKHMKMIADLRGFPPCFVLRGIPVLTKQDFQYVGFIFEELYRSHV